MKVVAGHYVDVIMSEGIFVFYFTFFFFHFIFKGSVFLYNFFGSDLNQQVAGLV